VKTKAKSITAPPPGPPWDSPIAEAPLAFVDLEMTGLDVAKDRVVEVCIERVVGGRTEKRLHSLVRPDVRAWGSGGYPPSVIGGVIGAAHVHGWDDAALASAPSFAELAPRITEALDGAIVVAHAADWDVAFLEAEMKRCGRSLAIPHALDTLTLARRAFAFRSYSLDALCPSLGIPRGRAHRADSDVTALRGVFERCVASLAPVSPRDLWEVRIAEKRARPAIVQACEAAVEHALQVSITYRPAKRGPQELRMILTQVRSDLDPPRVIGYQLPGRGRKELRADRILRIDPVPGS
jgi:DNA polymerase-3 subunit epsilon